MSLQELDRIIGEALVDRQFRQTLLDCPAKVLTGFDLSPEETSQISSINATSVEELAGKLYQWVVSRNGHEDTAPIIKRRHGPLPYLDFTENIPRSRSRNH